MLINFCKKYFHLFLCFFLLYSAWSYAASLEAQESIEHTSLSLASKKLKQQVKKEKNPSRLRALKASLACLQLNGKLGMKQFGVSEKELFQIALFIEIDLSKYIAEKKYYITPQESHLSCPIEYDPETRSCFIHLREILGGGAYKRVTRCIRYDVNTPEFFAACTQTVPMDKEIEMAKVLCGSKGLVQVKAFTTHIENEKVYYTLFCKHYQPGSLAKVLDLGLSQFTLEEKVTIALDILKGLETMQAKGVVHRDLKKENYLLNIKKNANGKKRKRTLEVAICDFGYASYACDAHELKAQGTTTYIAPEGLFANTMHGTDYHKTDLFASGCVLYRLFYNKKPQWQISSSVKDAESLTVRYRRLITCLEKETGEARGRIVAKLSKGLKLSLKEELEQVILTMVHPNPAKRVPASELRQRLEKAYLQLRKKS